MQIQSTARKPMAKVNNPKPAVKKEEAPAQKETVSLSNNSNGIVDFYNKNKVGLHIAGGALLGAAVAKYGGGLVGPAVMSAAGSGALGGFIAGRNTNKALAMGAGSVIGAGIAAFAGMPGTHVMSAAGTGALLGFLFG